MRCPKCGGEIPFFDLKPNCRHCGVNIMYFTQETELARDAKRTELEGAAARMVIARVKANFIGGKVQIARIVCTLLSVAALLVPFGSVRYSVPFFDKTFSAGLLGIVQSVQSGFFMQIPSLLGSTLLRTGTWAAVVPTAFLVLCAVLDLLLAAALLLGFLNLTRSTTFMQRVSLCGVAVSSAAQIAVLVLYLTLRGNAFAPVRPGFGALAALAMYLVVFFLNRTLLKNGIEPKFRENDLKRKELLRRVRAGEVDLDTLPLPIFESDEERKERLRALEEALKAEEEGKEL